MTLHPVRGCLVVLSLTALGFARPEPDASKEDLAKRAGAFVDLLTKEDYAKAGKDFDETMRKVMPEDKLKETWQAVLKQVGAFQKRKGTRGERAGKYDVVYVTCDFAKATLDVRVVFDADKHVSGLFFAPTKNPDPPYEAPEYVRREAFREVEVKFGEDPWTLPGTLSLPTGAGPFRVVILVHGSGPQDRDETIGANRPFRDLAWGLTTRGIAVLRYDKRTKTHGAKMTGDATIEDEVLADVRAAAKFLRSRKEIDGGKVFVAGHSLGGTLLPWIGTNDSALAGLISLAGSTRPIEDVIVEQLSYLASLDSTPSPEQKQEWDRVQKLADELKNLKRKEDAPVSQLYFGATAGYWLNLRAYSSAEAARKVKQPMLILQGERDYQVTMKDFALWKERLGERKNVAFKSYPKLNHLFMEGEGKSRPAEYQRPGHVAVAIVDDVAAWVKKQ